MVFSGALERRLFYAKKKYFAQGHLQRSRDRYNFALASQAIVGA
jgi:hypothetical protein